ncbi:hypothetical protein S100390_v1c01870 [Spiroplasma sp. NBRC 100390]|uniref:hypothetical protein n=1 Tax=unclassified Spiroplasma TaxID=2637901 RepID=UPI0008928F9E|nr:MULTISPECIES: hypothetical protein [unclassified Spiroplasma]AOX43530.1 hypothetical protein STU14_v1c01870 [Spiroplasma sp. TU-14]APE13000.1 hypothetical protein S100390_v1c01870 [Spiroplasma sp. NBRC 100390]
MTAFYIHSSDENTFIWTKKLPQGTKYNLFTVEVKEKSNYWAEGLDFNYFNQKVHLPLGSMNNIWLINNKQQDKTIIEERRVTLLGEPMNSRLIDVINIKLSLNLQYFNNVITARFTASAAVKNTSLFSWVKTQAKFYFKISVSKNGSL